MKVQTPPSPSLTTRVFPLNTLETKTIALHLTSQSMTLLMVCLNLRHTRYEIPIKLKKIEIHIRGGLCLQNLGLDV